MELKENIVDKELFEWIQGIKPLPEWVKLYKLNHHSPSQINAADDMWGYKYLYLTQEERRNLPINSKMHSGVCIGDMGQYEFGNYIWKFVKGKGLVKTEIPKTKKIFEKVLDKFDAYQPASEEDKLSHQENKKGLAKTYHQLKWGLKDIKLTSPIECERSVSLELPGCQLPVIGRVDFEDENNFVELKTKWYKKNRPRKDGTSSYSVPKIDEGYMGWNEHILQVAFYYLATRKKPHLLVINPESYNIFTPDNCEDLKPENLKKLINKMRVVCKRREEIMERHSGKTTWVEDIFPDFDHFFWRGMGDHLTAAMRLWGHV
tara:strand:+ start:360 stop:1313 length:954 start_codon:yes stop_codon:yes gene_type:complete